MLKSILSKWLKDEDLIVSIKYEHECRVFVRLSTAGDFWGVPSQSGVLSSSRTLSHAHYLPTDAWRFIWHSENKKLFFIFEHMFTLFILNMSDFSDVLGNVSLT
jgi:hypothetical protein